MAGAMNKSDVTRDSFPLHFAIADALGGTVEPFDVYQGPYVAIPGDRLFIQSVIQKCDYGDWHDTGLAEIWAERKDRVSQAFPAHSDKSPEYAVHAAQFLLATT